MTREIDEFLFSPSTSSAAPTQAAPLEARPLPPAAPAAPAASTSQSGPRIPPPPAPIAALPQAPFSASNVPMPSAESIAPEVAKAASVVRQAVPKPQAASAMSSLTDELSENWKPLALGAAAVIAAQVARGALANRRSGAKTPQIGTGGTGTPVTTPTVATEGPLFATEAETAAHEAAIDRRAQADKRMAEFEAMWAKRNAVAPTIEPLTPAAAPVEVPPTAVLETPATTAALATEQPGNVVADAVIRDELAKPAAVPPKAEPLRTGTGREVIAGEGPVKKRFDREYARPQDVPKGYAFVPGGQFMDTLRNALGQDLYTRELSKQAFPATYPATEELARQINRAEGRMTRAELEAAGLPKGEGTAGITRKVGPGKTVKVAGAAGALVALSDLARAENAQQRGEAILGAVLPPFADVLPAAAPGVPQSRLAAAALLGSPYAQTEWAKTQRLRERAGAGRGLINPVPPR